jgi:hypothetical protein
VRRRPPSISEGASNPVDAVRLVLVFAFPPGGVIVQPGGPPPPLAKAGSTLTYCREMVTNKGITDVTRLEHEVKSALPTQ